MATPPARHTIMRALLPSQPEMPSRRRLESLGVICRPYSTTQVPELDRSTADCVCVVDESITLSDQWPQLRVRLARANRFFLEVVSRADTARVANAMRDGAFDVVANTDDDNRWRDAVENAATSQQLWWEIYGGRVNMDSERMIGGSRIMMDLRRDIQRLGPTDVTVLIIGESGAGKERVAASLHTAGNGGPYVTLNCAAMPRDLLEAELFGAERGAFTGANKSRPGLVEQANGGTLFLDEVGELDLALQPKFLRFLETRRARRVGGDREYAVRLRVVSATNRNLETEVNAGRFRADLYFRLAEVVLRPPPLRERLEDIPELTGAFLNAANERFGKNIETVEPGLVRKLQSYNWPGNVRELKSVIDRLVLFHDGPMLRDGWWEPPVVMPAQIAESAAINAGVGTHGAATAFAPVTLMSNPLASFGVPPGLNGPAGTPGVPFPFSMEQRLPTRSERVQLARQLLGDPDLTLQEVAARTGVHPTTLFRWRKSGKV
jgi:DNA-binding NtrC family response regulator